MAFVKIILLPLSVIYGVVTGVRNFLFHIGILTNFQDSGYLCR